MTDKPYDDDEPIPQNPAAAPPPEADPPRLTAERVADPPPPPPPTRRRRGAWRAPLVFALGAVVIGCVVAFLVFYPSPSDQPPSGQANQIAGLENEVQALTAKVNQLESRPPGDPAKLAALAGAVAALGHAPAPAAPDLTPIEDRVSALEKQVAARQAPAKQPPPETAAVTSLAGRANGLEKTVGPIPEQLSKLFTAEQSLSATQQKFAEEQQRIADDQQKLGDMQRQLGTAIVQAGGAQTAIKGLTDRIDQQQSTLAALHAAIGKVAASAGQAARAARVEAALAALDAGRPLGSVPDAPAAVARFAATPPPTLNGLRAEFPAVAKSVLAASQPAAGKKFLDRLWTNAQDLVTVRQGNHVLVGDPAAGVVARAEDDLNHADLAGAVAALATLNGPAAQAASGWLASARSLLDARAALLGMTGAA